MEELQDFHDIFVAARTVIHNVSAGGKSALSFPIDMKHIIRVVRELLSLRNPPEFVIRLFKGGTNNSQVWGQLFRFESHAHIYYKENLNVCYQRIVICKEIGHLLHDNEDKHFTDSESLIRNLITSPMPSDANRIVLNDLRAIYFAMEVLLPREAKPTITSMKDSGCTDRQIAEKFKCPEKFVNLMISKGYWNFSEAMHDRIDQCEA